MSFYIDFDILVISGILVVFLVLMLRMMFIEHRDYKELNRELKEELNKRKRKKY